MPYITILIILVSIIYFIYIVYQLLQFYYIIHPYKACLLSSSTGKIYPALDTIFNKYVDDFSKYDFVELGSGKANISRCVRKNFNFKNVIGVEGDFLTYLGSKVLNLGKNIKIINKNILKYTIENDNSILYCYLFPKLVNTLYKRGFFKNKLVIVLTFPIHNLEPDEVIQVKNFQKNIYVYDFRQKK